MTKHTPGPWIIQRYSTHEGFSIWAKDVGCIAERWWDTSIGEAIPIEANARLISAAPDMLEALKNLENDDGAIPEHAWKMVQDVIRKAENA